VTSIGEGAFSCCDSLIAAYFQGSEEQWNAIYIGSYNDLLENATIHFAIGADASMESVKSILQYSIKHANKGSKTSIQNAIYNLLFKAQFRPNRNWANGTAFAKLDFGCYQTDSTQGAVNANWPAKNGGGYKYTITDAALGTYNIGGGAGCNAYARFASAYTYGTKGSRTEGKYEQSGLEELIHSYADPGEHIMIGEGNVHSVVFLGESADGNGFYYADYGDNGGQSPNITFCYATYENFAQTEKYKGKAFYVFDTNGGSYYAGTAKSVEQVRAAQSAPTKIVQKIACPVEVTVTLGDEVLDSRNAPASASFGTVRREGETIIFTLDYRDDYETKIIGTDTGTMTMTVSYYDEEESTEILIDERQFVDVPITSDTEIQAVTSDVLGTCILIVDADGSGANEKAWGAGINETVYEADPMYSSENQIDNIMANIDIASQDSVYQISGQLIALSQNAVVYCAVYQEDGKFLRVKSQEFSASDVPQSIDIQINASDSDGYLQLFVLDSVGNAPLDECVQIPVG
jgi:hypothetical protein